MTENSLCRTGDDHLSPNMKPCIENNSKTPLNYFTNILPFIPSGVSLSSPSKFSWSSSKANTWHQPNTLQTPNRTPFNATWSSSSTPSTTTTLQTVSRTPPSGNGGSVASSSWSVSSTNTVLYFYTPPTRRSGIFRFPYRRDLKPTCQNFLIRSKRMCLLNFRLVTRPLIGYSHLWSFVSQGLARGIKKCTNVPFRY